MDTYSGCQGIPVEFTVENVPEEIGTEIAFCVYRITQEGLRNITKHARADRVRVRLLGRNGDLELTIEDTGKGFDTKRAHAGLGLASMAERVRLVQGALTLHSTPGEGTRIEVRAPLTGTVQ